MNLGRLALAAIAATIADGVYGFLVWGQLLSGAFAPYPAIFRSSADQTAYFPLMFAGVLAGMFVASWIYAKGCEHGSGALEGLRFGALMGLLIGAYMAGVNYGLLRIGRRLALTYAVGWLGEWLVVGLVFGLLYRPAERVVGRAAGV